MAQIAKEQTSISGAYIHAGPRDHQLYAEIPKSDGLVAVLEVDTDCPGRVFSYFMRGGFSESAMSVDELRRGAVALNELLQTALETWPRKLTPREDT